MTKTVINKNNGKKYEVFDVARDNAGYPHYLIYKDNQWIYMSAKHFRPYTAEDYEREYMESVPRYYDTGAETTLYFDNYDA